MDTSTHPRKFDLEERLIDFSVMMIDVIEKLPNAKGANHIGSQAIRSSSSPALNYGEAIEAESRKDFIYKMSICRKELRETRNSLRILIKRPYREILPEGEIALKECKEFLAIFSKSIQTAKRNLGKNNDDAQKAA